MKYPALLPPGLAGPTGEIVSTAREQYLSFHPRNIYYMIRFRCLFREEGKSKREIDLFFRAARRDPFHNGLIIPACRQDWGGGTFRASTRVAFQAEQM